MFFPFRICLWLSLATAVAFASEPVRARRAMVVAQEPHAADAGVAILKSGGNAVDAAVTVALALAVTHPTAGNLGGGGFLLLRTKSGETAFFDFRERAPKAATRDMYLDDGGNPTPDSLIGWRAAGVPGTVRGLELAHQRFGRKNWAELVSPAVKLARDGFPLSYATVRSLDAAASKLGRFPDSRRIFLNDGRGYQPGDLLVQPGLARTLARIQAEGAHDFYEGETARILAEESARHGGLITLDDLKSYTAVERVPLKGQYRDMEIVTAPPPSSGGLILLEVLGMLEGSGYERAGAGSADALTWIAEAMKRAYADRAEHMGDPGHWRVPVTFLTSKQYLERRRQSIDPSRATPAAEISAAAPPKEDSPETTHFSIVDEEGNAVALTYTINGGYGNGVTVPRLGFLLNNEMDDFSVKPGVPNMYGAVGGEANAIQPGKRPLSSMTPTIVTRGGKLYLVLGAPGGTRIPNGVIQAFLHVVDFRMNMQQAIDAPRIHHQWKPDRLFTMNGVSPDTLQILRSRGYQVEPGTPGVAAVEGILVGSDGWLQGGSDTAPRQSGKAAGY
jgi:gamma-glutamyltranspeptidase/glutathione hydrolase